MADNKKVVVTQVTVFQPGERPVIYNTSDETIQAIEAGIVGNLARVVIVKKDSTRIMFIDIPYTVWTAPEEAVVNLN